MFGQRYFGNRFFGGHYWGHVGDFAVVVSVPGILCIAAYQDGRIVISATTLECEAATMDRFIKCFPAGAIVRLDAFFYLNEVDQQLDEGTDPAAVTLKIKRPDGSADEYEYGVGDAIERDDDGKYHASIEADDVGEWTYGFKGAGTPTVVAQEKFKVADSLFAPGSP